MFVITGLDIENPGETTKKKWENLRFPAIKFREDLDEFFQTVTMLYRQMVRHGIIVPGYARDEIRLVDDLKVKVDKGTQFRFWFYGQPGLEDVVELRGWIDRASLYRAMLPSRRNEPVNETREVQNGAQPSPGVTCFAQEVGQPVDPDEEHALWECVGRLNDLRQARSGLSKGSKGAGRTPGRASREALDAVPYCSECRGRHVIKPCPNVIAQKQGFDCRMQQQTSAWCSFRDTVHPEVACSGKGHTAKHHHQGEAEAAARTSVGGSAGAGASAFVPPRGTATTRGPKTVGRGTAGGKGGGKAPRPKGGKGGESGRGMKPLFRMRTKRREPGRVAEEGEEDEEEDIETVGYIIDEDEEGETEVEEQEYYDEQGNPCLLYTSPSPRD